MVTLNGIQGIRENALAPNSRTRGAGTVESGAQAEDRLDISPEARDAAVIAQLVESVKDSEIRKEKVEEAKRRVEEGTYRVVDIVNVVAQRISGMVSNF
jgi:anti-sigma28 factor (negative regulator of flagellin synthesis)